MSDSRREVLHDFFRWRRGHSQRPFVVCEAEAFRAGKCCTTSRQVVEITLSGLGSGHSLPPSSRGGGALPDLFSRHGLSRRISNCLSTDGGPFISVVPERFSTGSASFRNAGKCAAEREVFDGARGSFLEYFFGQAKKYLITGSDNSNGFRIRNTAIFSKTLL